MPGHAPAPLSLPEHESRPTPIYVALRCPGDYRRAEDGDHGLHFPVRKREYQQEIDCHPYNENDKVETLLHLAAPNTELAKAFDELDNARWHEVGQSFPLSPWRRHAAA